MKENITLNNSANLMNWLNGAFKINMIEKLTKEQEKRFPEFVKKME